MKPPGFLALGACAGAALIVAITAAPGAAAETADRGPPGVKAARLATLGLGAAPVRTSRAVAPAAADPDTPERVPIDAGSGLRLEKLVTIVSVDGVRPAPGSTRLDLDPGTHSISILLRPAPARYCFFVDDCVFAATSSQSRQDLCVVGLHFTAEPGHHYEIRWSTTERASAAHERGPPPRSAPPEFDYDFTLLDRTRSDAIVGYTSCRPEHSRHNPSGAVAGAGHDP